MMFQWYKEQNDMLTAELQRVEREKAELQAAIRRAENAWVLEHREHRMTRSDSLIFRVRFNEASDLANDLFVALPEDLKPFFERRIEHLADTIIDLTDSDED